VTERLETWRPGAARHPSPPWISVTPCDAFLRFLRALFMICSASPRYPPTMAQRSRSGLIVALTIFVALAVVIRLFGGPLYKALLALHGRH
jgi:hypothetical protein